MVVEEDLVVPETMLPVDPQDLEVMEQYHLFLVSQQYMQVVVEEEDILKEIVRLVVLEAVGQVYQLLDLCLLVVEEVVVDIQMLSVAVKVVPVSSSSPTHHKYSKSS